MHGFLKTSGFKELNLGFALDEGLANPGNKYSVFYAERCIWCKFSNNIYLLTTFKVTHSILN